MFLVSSSFFLSLFSSSSSSSMLCTRIYSLLLLVIKISVNRHPCCVVFLCNRTAPLPSFLSFLFSRAPARSVRARSFDYFSIRLFLSATVWFCSATFSSIRIENVLLQTSIFVVFT